MTLKLSDLALPEIDIKDPAFVKDPFVQYRAAIQQHWLAKTAVGYMVLGYQDMKDLLLMDDKLDTPVKAIITQTGAKEGPWSRWADSFLLATSGDEHKRIRDLVASTFTSRNAELHRPAMREVVTTLLDEWVPKGRFDFVELASYFPVAILCRLIGAPANVVPEIEERLQVIGAGFSMNPEVMSALTDAIEYMLDFVDGLIEDRMAQAGEGAGEEDLLDQLLRVTDRENGLRRKELCDLILQLIVSGYHTSKSLLVMIVNILMDRPGDWKRLAQDENFAKLVTNESLRYANIITIYRIANEPIVFKGVTIPKGTMLIFPLPFAGRDESVFSNANRFDPERVPEATHFAFGRGVHVCLGQFIARVEMEVGLPILASRLTNLVRDGEIAWRPFLAVWGPSSMPVKIGEMG